MVLYAVCLMEPTLVRHSPSLSNIMNSWCYYLSYVSSTSYKIYKLKLPHKLTTERILHSRVKLSIAQNVDCCFS